MKLFYDHLLIELDDVYLEIEKLQVTTAEKKKLVTVIDQTSHHLVLDTILKNLHQDHHHTFLEKFHKHPHHSQNIKFLKTHVDDIEAQITKAVKDLKSTLLAEFNS